MNKWLDEIEQHWRLLGVAIAASILVASLSLFATNNYWHAPILADLVIVNRHLTEAKQAEQIARADRELTRTLEARLKILQDQIVSNEIRASEVTRLLRECSNMVKQPDTGEKLPELQIPKILQQK